MSVQVSHKPKPPATPTMHSCAGWKDPSVAVGVSTEDRPLAIGTVLHFASDRELYGEGEGANSFYKVVSGMVRTCKLLSDGRRQIDAFYTAGEVFGLESGSTYRFSAEAVCDCSIVSYRRQGSESSPGQGLLSIAIHEMTRAQNHALLLGRRSAGEKVAAFLLELKPRLSDAHTVILVMTRQDIADYLGLTVETVSRTLSQFERDGLIELYTARQIFLKDIAALQGCVL